MSGAAAGRGLADVLYSRPIVRGGIRETCSVPGGYE
jgi:hypothetical protein